jgi:hypothetical protein
MNRLIELVMLLLVMLCGTMAYELTMTENLYNFGGWLPFLTLGIIAPMIGYMLGRITQELE